MTHRGIRQTRRREESGFALLMIFVMAALIAIGLYYEMPRVAFESQRAREQLLVDRGMQYRRAIQLFYRKFGRYPASMDDLETTNNIRFLRHKYKDPMTGKDDWRIIHMGPGGILTDSLVQKAQDPLKADKDKQAADASATGTNPADQSAGLNLATVRRPSDQMAGGPPGGTGQPTNPNDPNDPNQPLQPLPLPGQPVQPGQPGQPGQPPQPGQILNPAQPYDPNNPNPQQPQPALPLQPYDPNNPNPPQPPPGFIQGRGGFVPAPIVPGAPTTTAGQPGVPGNQATTLIGNLLNAPRTPPSSFTSSANSTSGTGTTGGGIAGVASKYEGKGIKVINERKKYKEWEFVYDFKNDSGKQQQIPGQQQAGQTGQPGQTGQTTGSATGAAGTAGTPQPGTPTTPTTSQ